MRTNTSHMGGINCNAEYKVIVPQQWGSVLEGLSRRHPGLGGIRVLVAD